MKLVVQRVSNASIFVKNKLISKINRGLLVFIGIEIGDSEKDINWLVNKLLNLRVFTDEKDKFNLSIRDIDGEILLVSQFTLLATTSKGNRPSFIRAERPDKAEKLYEKFKFGIKSNNFKKTKFGYFGQNMKVNIENDGPFTIILDSKRK